MKCAHCFQHVPFEGLGSIGPWLYTNGYTVTTTRFFAGEPLPRLDDVDLLIVMGGPMSVNDERDLSWLVDEKRFVREAVGAGKPVLGICLGAQLIASAMGARVYPNRVKEIGWLSVFGVPSDSPSVFRFPPVADVFHWHGETFDLPPGAVRLARSEHCENQAFQLGRRTLGLQFHLETTRDSACALVEHCRSELVPSATVQADSSSHFGLLPGTDDTEVVPPAPEIVGSLRIWRVGLCPDRMWKGQNENCCQAEATLLAAPPSAYARINALMAEALAYLTVPGRVASPALRG
jgi:GMP synthase-like glutamine amidotransferase